jgi:N-acetylmuramoyl-L-alanine amidase-like protein
VLLPLLLLSLIPKFQGAESTDSPSAEPYSAPSSSLVLQRDDFELGQLAALSTAQKDILQIRAPFPVRSVGIWWRGELLRAEFCLVDQTGTTGPWYDIVASHDLSPEIAGATGAAGTAQVSALLHHYGSPGIAVRLRLPELGALDQLSVIWVPSFANSNMPPRSKSESTTGYPKPLVYDRASWAADPPQCTSGYCNTSHIALHHTASASEYQSPDWANSAANVKATQAYHMYTRGWCDIGYNYLIDVHGYIFEGRAGGDDVRGAHDSYNCGSMGVAMMGYFHTPYNQTLNQAMRDAYCELAAWKCDQQNIDPLGSSHYAGYGSNMINLYGHRDVKSTACPGDLAYAELPALRQAVADKLNGGANQMVLDNDQALLIGNWNLGTSSTDKFGADYLWASTGTAPATAYWTPDIPQAGLWSVAYWWPQGSNRNPATRIGARINGSLYTSQVNQQQNGGRWNVIATVWLPAGRQSLIGLDNFGPTGHVVVADALRLIKQ